MATYIVLGKLTHQGIRTAKEIPERRARAQEAASSLGITWRDAWVTMGEYDIVIVLEAPSDEAVAQFVLLVGMQGNLSTQTLRGFTQAEAEAILSRL